MTDSLLWREPPMSIQTMSDFIEKLPIIYKQNIWQRHSNNGYISEYDILQTLHSFAALCIKLMDRTAKAPSKNDIEPLLKPLNSIIIEHISNNKNGMTKEEFNSKLHQWILEPTTPKDDISTKSVSPKIHILSPSNSYIPPSNNDLALVVATPIETPLKTSLKKSKSLNINKTCPKKRKPKMIALKKSKTYDTIDNPTASCDDLMLGGQKKNHNVRRKHNRKRFRKGKTNEFFCQINVGETVKLTNNRIAFIRYKGKVKFGIGIWYGLEIFDSFTKTRHNGTVFSKKYFNCPRNKGLFVKREIILSIVKPENIKKVLKDLEKKQIKKQKQLKKHQNNEEKIRKDFKRFARLSSAANDPNVLKLINKAKSFEEMDDIKEEIDDEKNIFDIIENNDDENEYKIIIYCQLNKYILQYIYEFNKGLYIEKVNNNSKEGRALILEFGIQANKSKPWYITEINNNRFIKQINIDSINKIMKTVNYTQGYNIVFKQY